MTYKPRRDDRFDSVGDIILHIEEAQCYSCRFREGDEPGIDDVMCETIALPIILEDPVEALDDHGKAGVVCTKYRPGDEPDFAPDPDQLPLF